MSRRFAILPFVACSLVLAVACSSSTSTPSAANTADASPSADGSSPTLDAAMASDSPSTQDGATVDASDAATDAGLVCGAVANTAPVINDTTSASAIPVGTGGAIVDGVYFFTANVFYAGGSVGQKSHSYTANIAGTSFGLQGHDNSDPDAAGGFNIASTLGGMISIVGTCPAGNVAKILGDFDSYTATATTLTLYSSTKKNGSVFTKQ